MEKKMENGEENILKLLLELLSLQYQRALFKILGEIKIWSQTIFYLFTEAGYLVGHSPSKMTPK